jgi:hypothetical protein
MQTTCRRAAMKRIFSMEVSNAASAARRCISPTPAPLNLGISSRGCFIQNRPNLIDMHQINRSAPQNGSKDVTKLASFPKSSGANLNKSLRLSLFGVDARFSAPAFELSGFDPHFDLFTFPTSIDSRALSSLPKFAG